MEGTAACWSPAAAGSQQPFLTGKETFAASLLPRAETHRDRQ